MAGLVPNFNRPAGNVTGMTLMSPQLGQKRLELLRELARNAAVVAMLVNPRSPDGVPEIDDLEVAAHTMGLGIKTFNAITSSELIAALIAIVFFRRDGVLVVSDSFPSPRSPVLRR